MQKPREEEREREREFSDPYDILKHVTTIHNNKLGMTSDYPLARLDDTERKFINGQLVVAQIIGQYIKDPEVAKDIANLFIAECDIKVNLKRNDPNNWLLEKIINAINGVEEPEKETNEGKGFMERIKSAMSRKNN